MSGYLKIGDRRFDGDQIISALVQYKLLEPLIGQILLDQVIQQITLTREELFRILIGGIEAEIPEDFEGFVTRWCQVKGITLDYFRAVMLRELRIQKFKQLQFADRVESEFLRLKADLDQVTYSLIQLSDLALAHEVYFQLRDDGADFAQLAQHYSSGQEQQAGGWIGPVSLSSLPAEITALFRNEQIGVVYGPIPVADRFWIVRLEQFTAARLTNATRANLIDRLYQGWLQTQIQQVVDTPGTITVQTNPAESALAPH